MRSRSMTEQHQQRATSGRYFPVRDGLPLPLAGEAGTHSVTGEGGAPDLALCFKSRAVALSRESPQPRATALAELLLFIPA